MGNLAFVPSPDATAEFKVQSNLYDAQYGRTGGGVINVILKSGTNAFHGAAYMYYRDEKLNANTFDGNRAGTPKADLYWNQPGVTISGPVRIPGLYDGRDKTFFMYSYERISSQIPFPQVFTVPSAAERAGDFSKTGHGDRRARHHLRPADDTTRRRTLHPRPVPGQPDPGEPDGPGRAEPAQVRAVAERGRADEQPARAREQPGRRVQQPCREGRSDDQSAAPLLRAVRVEPAPRDQRLHGLREGSGPDLPRTRAPMSASAAR